MATYVNDLRLKEITPGDEDGTWGGTTNTTLEVIAEAFSYGTLQLAADADETFTMADGTTSQVRSMAISVTSAGSLTSTRTITLAPTTVSKVWAITNATTGSQSIIVKQGSGATVTILTGMTKIVATDGAGAGAAVVEVPPAVNVASQVTGTLAVANGGTGITSLGTGVATFLGTPSSANLASAVTDETGSGALVFATSPTLVTPALGTPSALVLTNATGTPTSIGLTNGTGLPISTGVSGLGTGVATFLATPSSANLAAAVTDETGSGALVFGTAPALVNANLITPALGTPTAGVLTNATGLPLTTGVTGTLAIANGGTNAATAAGARASIFPTFAGNAGKGLVVNAGATDVEYIALPGGGTVTSIDISGGTTGLTATGGPITTAGTITLAGTLAVANGGTGITAFGTGVATALGVNVGSAGAFVAFDGALGTPTSGTLTNATGLPLTTGVTGTLPVANGGTGITSFGTGVATALGVNVGSAGAFVAFDGALGTPTSGTLTNCTGLPAAGVTGTAAILGANTFTAAQNFADNQLQRPILVDYAELTNAIGSTGGGTQDIDLTLGNSVTATVDTSANTFTFSNPTASDEGCGFILKLTDGGSQTVNWPASVDWNAATAPTLTVSGVDVLAFYTWDGGTTWYGFVLGQAMA